MNEVAGQLIKSGRFRQAIPLVLYEMKLADDFGLLTNMEKYGENGLLERLFKLMLNPDYNDAQALGESFMQLAMRIPTYLPQINKDTFLDNVKLNYEVA